MPYMPRFETVNVPSGEIGGRARGRAHALDQRGALAGDLAQRAAVGVSHNRHEQCAGARDRDAHVDALRASTASPAIGAVDCGVLAQGAAGERDDDVVDGRGAVAHGGAQPRAQAQHLAEVDVHREPEVRHARDRLAHALGDRALDAGQRDALAPPCGGAAGRRLRGGCFGGSAAGARPARVWSAGSPAISTSASRMRPRGPVPCRPLSSTPSFTRAPASDGRRAAGGRACSAVSPAGAAAWGGFAAEGRDRPAERLRLARLTR